MERLSTGLSLLLKHWITRLFAAHASQVVVGSITWADLGVALCYLTLALLITVPAAWFVRRHAPTAAVHGEPIHRHLFAALAKPVYAWLWACALYFAVTPLLLTLPADETLLAVRGFLGGVFDLGVFAVLLWALLRLTHVLEVRLTLWASRTAGKLDDLFVPLFGKSVRALVVVTGVILGLPLLRLPADYAAVAAQGTGIVLISAIAYILFQAVRAGERAVLGKFDITVSDNLRARKIYTQVHVISRVLDVMISLFAAASMLMLFAEVRHVGTSLLASAGIAGIIAGIAAQKTLANLLAGFQIALAQPIRQDDVVIVDGEWGRVEEITLSYVVVHIWDDRRLVVPLSYFIEKPFQNWTRASAQLIGSVFVYVDYSFPVEAGRRALQKIIEGSPLWDKRFWNLQVTDSSDRTMQLRVLATSADSSSAWNLRCEIREKFIAYIQDHHPQSLPQLRARLNGPAVLEP